MTLEEETERLRALIGGLTVVDAVRSKPGELIVRLTSRTRLYVNAQSDGTLDLSVEGGNDWQDKQS